LSAEANVPVQQLFDLHGKAALVTGGATGIGLQMARALAEAGADVAICARDAGRCEEAALELTGLGRRSLGLHCDVSDPGDVSVTVERVVEELGRLDILINNSGTSWGAPTEDYPLEGWQKVIDVNLTGTFLCSQAVGRVMLEQGSGKIINIASVAGIIGGSPELRQAVAYSASKGGVLAFTRDLACQWGRRGITVNAIAPGWFRSSMADKVLDENEAAIAEGIPLGRVGNEHELKGVVVFLAGAASDHITGQTIVVDGGKSIW